MKPEPPADARLPEDFQKERPKLNAWLRERGIEDDIQDLYYSPNLSPRCVTELLELLESPYSFRTRSILARAILHRKPEVSQKRRAFTVFLGIVKQRAGQYDVVLSTLVLNELAEFATPDRVHEIGEMTLDARYGLLRAEFTFVLRKIGSAEAVAYLIRAAKDSVTAALALDGLAYLHVDEALKLCEEALERPDTQFKDAIKRTHSKLKRRAAKTQPGASRATSEAIPEGLAEWSVNVDGADLQKVLRGLHRNIEQGFGKAEILEVISICEGSSPNQTERFKFAVKSRGEETTLWLEIFSDDEDAFDLYFFGPEELINRIEKAMENILP